MYVIDVIPFAAGAPEGALSYRSGSRIAEGAIVEVTLRGKRVRGMAVSCESVREAKGSLKRAPFALKSGTLARKGALPTAVVGAGRVIARYHAAPLGSVLAALVSETLPGAIPSKLCEGSGFLEAAIEMPFEDRMKEYEKTIKEQARAKRATLIIAPTSIELMRLAGRFAAYAPIVLSGALKGERRAAMLSAAATAASAASPSRLVIATPAFAWTPIAALGAVIVERASAGSYTFAKRPYLDARLATRELARARALPFMVGDYPLPIEWRADPSAPIPIPMPNPSALPSRDANTRPSSSTATARIFDARKEKAEAKQGIDQETAHKPFLAVPEPFLKRIGGAIEHGGRAAVLAVRRGYSPSVVCRDCGSAVRDTEGRALSFSTGRGARIFRSADGTVIKTAEAVCDVCGSWNLLPLGVGVERVAEEIKAAYPGAPVVMLDTDSIRTPSQAARASRALLAPGTIIIGTEFMLPFLDPAAPVEYAAIASADSLLSLPFWRARERLVHAGLTLRERALSLDIATRRPDDASFSAIADPSSSAFFAEETALREQFGYPPFGHLVRVRALASPGSRDAVASGIRAAFGARGVIEMPDRRLKGRIVVTFLAKFPKDAWPDESASPALAALPPSVGILVDSDSLW